MFFKYLNSDRQPIIFAPVSKVRTPHVPGSDAPSSRIIFQDEHMDRAVSRTGHRPGTIPSSYFGDTTLVQGVARRTTDD